MARGKAEPREGESREGESVDVTSRTYHTHEGVAHPEGETYAVTDRWLAETLYAIGFVSIDGWTPPVEPPPPAPLGREDDDDDRARGRR
jgi:hypothetical protein